MGFDAPEAGAVDPRRTARGTALALIASVLEKGGGMLMLLLIARLFDRETFGLYAALMSAVALCQVAAEFGQEPVLVRLLARARPPAAAATVQGALGLRLVLAVAAGLPLVGAGALVVPGVERGVLALAALGVLASVGTVFRAWFRTTHRIEWLCVIALARLLTFALALGAAAVLELGLAGAVAAWAAAQLAVSVTGASRAAHAIPPWPRWHGAVAGGLLQAGWAIALNGLLLTVTLRVGQLIVLHWDGAESVGLLAAGARLAEAFALIPEAVMVPLLPVLAAYRESEHESQRQVSARAVRYLGLLALAAILVLSIAAPTWLRLLFGADYEGGAPALRVLVWLALLGATGTVFTNLLIARGRERLLLVLSAVGSALTLALSLLLVPGTGFVGAAVATLIGSVLSQAVLLLLPATRADVLSCLRPLAAPVVVAAALALGGAALAGPPLVTTAGALTVFAGFVIASGALGRADVALLREALRAAR